MNRFRLAALLHCKALKEESAKVCNQCGKALSLGSG